MNFKINSLVTRIFGIVTILIAVSMISPIYTANTAIQTAITSASNSAHFMVTPTLLPFGPIIILLGIMFSGGILLWKGDKMNAGIGYMIGTVISIVGVIVVLSMMPSLITQFDTALTGIVAANDAIGELFVGTVLPLLIYLLVAIAPAVAPAVSVVRNGKKGKSAKTASAMAY